MKAMDAQRHDTSTLHQSIHETLPRLPFDGRVLTHLEVHELHTDRTEYAYHSKHFEEKHNMNAHTLTIHGCRAFEEYCPKPLRKLQHCNISDYRLTALSYKASIVWRR